MVVFTLGVIRPATMVEGSSVLVNDWDRFRVERDRLVIVGDSTIIFAFGRVGDTAIEPLVPFRKGRGVRGLSGMQTETSG